MYIYSKRLRPIPPGRDWGLLRRQGSWEGPCGPYFGGFWGGLVSILGALGFHFEGPGGLKTAVEVQEPPGRGPRATGKGSGRRRVRPGPAREAFLVPTWPQHGPILGPKIEQKSVGRRCEKASIFGWPSGSNLERFWEGFGSENGPMLALKIDPKMDVILEGPIPQITHET